MRLSEVTLGDIKKEPSRECLERLALLLRIPSAAILWVARSKPEGLSKKDEKLYDRVDGLVKKMVECPS